jgi:hypothetical protein
MRGRRPDAVERNTTFKFALGVTVLHTVIVVWRTVAAGLS